MSAPRTLVYCGIHKCETFAALASNFNLCYGFEADPELAHEAQKRFAHNPNIHIVHAAVAMTSGSIVLNVHSNAAATSLGRLGEPYRVLTGNDVRPIHEVTVPAINLYEYLVSRQVEYIDLYVSDIQGMDLAVLSTLKPFIDVQKIKEIMCETERDEHAVQAYEGLPSNRQSRYAEVLDNSYRVVRKQKVMPNWAHQDVTWKLRRPYLVRWHLRRAGLM